MILALSCGSAPACTSLMPVSAAIRRAAPALSPVTRITPRPRLRVRGWRFGRSRDGKQLILTSLDRHDLTHPWPSIGQRAGLVQHHLLHQAEALEGLAGSHQDSVVGGFTGATHDGERRGNADR